MMLLTYSIVRLNGRESSRIKTYEEALPEVSSAFQEMESNTANFKVNNHYADLKEKLLDLCQSESERFCIGKILTALSFWHLETFFIHFNTITRKFESDINQSIHV